MGSKRIMGRALTMDDLGEELFRSFPEERNTSHKELIEDDSHGPPVHCLTCSIETKRNQSMRSKEGMNQHKKVRTILTIALPEDDLRSNVLRCAKHLLVFKLLVLLIKGPLIHVGSHWKGRIKHEDDKHPLTLMEGTQCMNKLYAILTIHDAHFGQPKIC